MLHLIPHLIKGGAERQLVYMTSYWARSGRDVHVAYLADTPIEQSLLDAGVKLHPLKHLGNNDPALLLRIVRLLRRLAPDVVQTWLLQMDILGGCAARLTSTPWVLREPVGGLHWIGGLKTKFRERIGAGADAIVANSEGGDAYWSKIVPERKRFVIRNVVPVDDIRSVTEIPQDVRAQFDNRPLIIAAGRLDSQKNFGTLIRALARTVDVLGAQAVIFGEGPLRAQLAGEIERTGMRDRIHLPGSVASIWGALNQARLFVSMSRYEGNPNVVLEAMACGCPLVLSDIPSHREILDDQSAFFVQDFENQDRVAETILNAWNRSCESAAKAAAARGRLGRTFHVSNVCAQYDRVYQTVVAKRNGLAEPNAGRS